MEPKCDCTRHCIDLEYLSKISVDAHDQLQLCGLKFGDAFFDQDQRVLT